MDVQGRFLSWKGWHLMDPLASVLAGIVIVLFAAIMKYIHGRQQKQEEQLRVAVNRADVELHIRTIVDLTTKHADLMHKSVQDHIQTIKQSTSDQLGRITASQDRLSEKLEITLSEMAKDRESARETRHKMANDINYLTLKLRLKAIEEDAG